MKIYQKLARAIGALNRCIAEENGVWTDKWEENISDILKTAPSGSGIDAGTGIDIDKSTGEKIVLYAEFHHMNENGMYDGWTDHMVIVTPSLERDFNLRITGKNRNQIKDYLAEVYSLWLNEDAD